MTAGKGAKTGASYRLEGTLVEACSCPMPCACWVGEDPPGGYCYALNAFHLTSGHVGGTDVSGIDLVRVIAIPGNVRTPGSWREVLLVDDKASDEQCDSLVSAFKGEQGGPLADIARLVDEVLGVERVPTEVRTKGGKITVNVQGMISAEVRPVGGHGHQRSHVAPSHKSRVAKADVHRVDLPAYGMVWEYQGRSAVQRDYLAEHPG
jgi:hypothetical protein